MRGDPGVVLVTGSTGYVGGRLAPRLLRAGWHVRCLVRDPARLAGRPWSGRAEVVPGDVLRPESLAAALRGVRFAYYLVQGRGGADQGAARSFAAAAAAAGVEQIVHLGCLGAGAAGTEEALRAADASVTAFRAGPILGSGSLSFETIRYLAERLPLMVGPRWVHTPLQPIALHNLLEYLVALLDRPAAWGRTLEIGGADVTTYAGMIAGYARLRGLRRRMVTVPVRTPRLSSLWMDLVTPVPAAIARPLVEGLLQGAVVRDPAARELFPEVLPFDSTESMRVALAALDAGEVETRWSDALATSRGDVSPLLLTGHEGMIVEQRQIVVRAVPEAVFRSFSGIGGEVGWLYWQWAWRLRGLVDRLVGGAGLRRGRRDPEALRVGDALDFWRVEAVQPGELLRLRAEMKVPGRAWLQFKVAPHGDGESVLSQTAFFAPKGLAGLLYWYLLYPVHAFVFSGLVHQVGARASELSARKPHGHRSMHLPQASQRSGEKVK